MGLFGALVKTCVNVVTLPVSVARDVVMAPIDAQDGDVGQRTAATLKQIKDDVDDE
jgi:hypothetical protein